MCCTGIVMGSLGGVVMVHCISMIVVLLTGDVEVMYLQYVEVKHGMFKARAVPLIL